MAPRDHAQPLSQRPLNAGDHRLPALHRAGLPATAHARCCDTRVLCQRIVPNVGALTCGKETRVANRRLSKLLLDRKFDRFRHQMLLDFA